MRTLLTQGKAQPCYGLLGPRKPEAYALNLPGVKKPVYVLGPYLVATGGCDLVQPYDLILDLIEKYAAKGHVLLEGVLVSSSYGRVGQLMERWGQEAVMAFMTTTLEQCITNVQKRRDARDDKREFDPTNLTSKFHSIVKSREKMEAEKKVRVVELTMKDGPKQVLALLKGAK